jgi:putative flippase GtrA
VKRLLERTWVRFGLVGCANTALDFAMLNLLTLVAGLPVILANTLSVALGICISYVLNHVFVFRYPERLSLRRFLAFFAVTGFSSLVLQNVVILALEALFDTSFGHSLLFLQTADGDRILALNVAKAAAVSVGLVWNFALYRLLVFRTRRATASRQDYSETETSFQKAT